MRTRFLYIILGATLFQIAIACSMGGKRLDYKDFPVRSNSMSAFMKCPNGELHSVCKYTCKKYKKNKCKEPGLIKINLKDAIDRGYVVISKELFIRLISGVR